VNPAALLTRPFRLRGLLAVLVLTISVVLGTATAAQAHTALGSSNPADGSTLTTPLPAVGLTFTGQVLLGEVTVTGPTGASAATGAATANGAVVTQPVTLTAAGTYTVGYAVTSGDGHPLEGTLTFTYAPPAPAGDAAAPTSASAAPPAGSAAAEPNEAAVQSPAQQSGGVPGWVLAAAAAAALLVAGAVLVIVGRLRARS
jgi:methionine-rich copper-binding protein CopC